MSPVYNCRDNEDETDDGLKCENEMSILERNQSQVHNSQNNDSLSQHTSSTIYNTPISQDTDNFESFLSLPPIPNDILDSEGVEDFNSFILPSQPQQPIPKEVMKIQILPFFLIHLFYHHNLNNQFQKKLLMEILIFLEIDNH